METDIHKNFRDWVSGQNVYISDAIEAMSIPGEGTGIVATRQLRVNLSGLKTYLV
jgi:hypothetical protein